MFGYKLTPEFLYADVEDVTATNHTCVQSQNEAEKFSLLDETKARDSLIDMLHEREEFKDEALNDLLGSTSIHVGWSDERANIYD